MNSNQLPIPPVAATDQSALELVRVWAAKGAQHVSINPHVWKDPAAWGVMLVDLAKHISNAYSQTQDISFDAALSRIREGFDAEWRSPTDRPRGQV